MYLQKLINVENILWGHGDPAVGPVGRTRAVVVLPSSVELLLFTQTSLKLWHGKRSRRWLTLWQVVVVVVGIVTAAVALVVIVVVEVEQIELGVGGVGVVTGILVLGVGQVGTAAGKNVICGWDLGRLSRVTLFRTLLLRFVWDRWENLKMSIW